MRDATLERLTKIISDNPKEKKFGKKPLPRLGITLNMRPEEGWLSFFLVAVVVYSTIWSIQAVGWVAHLQGLTLITLLGLVAGMLATKQKHVPRLLMHVVAILLGLVLGLWQASSAYYGGSSRDFLIGVQHWFSIAVLGGFSDDDSIFLFFIVTLTFILAYTSAWLVYRTRSPWLMVFANAVVLLINLNGALDSFILFLILFLVSSLMLLLRFNLYESILNWRRQGLRYSDDISWDFMQAGTLFSIGILVFSWILPGNYTNDLASQIWKIDPLVQFQSVWNRVVAVDGGANPSNPGSFRDQLTLAGNPNLNNATVFTVQSDDTNGSYLMSLAYDTYNGHGWNNDGGSSSTALQANKSYLPSAQMTYQVKQKITVVTPPNEQSPYILGASQIVSANVPSKVVVSENTGDEIAWLSQGSALLAGTTYTVVSYASAADVTTLRLVPMPSDAVNITPGDGNHLSPTVYNPAILSPNTKLPANLDPRIKKLATQIVTDAHALTMYDKVTALENYLRTNYSYSVDIQLPQRAEPVSWFLFDSGNKGFCNYFASAMAVMARSLDIPARVVVGYAPGKYDPGKGQWTIKGTDAHAWTQVYFAGYGWVNFEPSKTFAQFVRPKPQQYAGSSTGTSATDPTKGATAKTHTKNDPDSSFDPAHNGTANASPVRPQVGIAFGSGLILFLLLFGILFMLWWRQLFRGYGVASQIFGRLCLLTSWAGLNIEPSQTPFEYMNNIAQVAPEEKATIERLSDIYVRDRWADPKSSEHPLHRGEMREMDGIWRKLQPRLALYVVRHPHFLATIPRNAWRTFSETRRQRQRRRQFNRGEIDHL